MTYEFMKEYDVWDCPFCGARSISVVRYPSSISVKRSKTASLPGSKGFHRSPDVYVVKGGCSKCGKTMEEVEAKFTQEGML